MKGALLLITLVLFIALCSITSCVHNPQVTVVLPDGGYPDSIAKIILNKCTYSGCHNQASYQTAGELQLDSWDHLFQGASFGAAVVPYSANLSPLLFYCNPDSTLGTRINDPIHFNKHPLPTIAEYLTLARWVSSGAPDKNGAIPFASDPDTRQKIYLTISGCNLIAVIDAKSKQIMRYIPVGTYPGNESLHDVEISADGRYGYLSFFNGTFMQKIDIRTDTVINTLNLAGAAVAGQGAWSVFYMSPADTAIMLSGMMANGYIITANTAAMHINEHASVDQLSGGTSAFNYPHGLTSNAAFDTFYATMQNDNRIVKFSFNNVGLNSPQYINVATPAIPPAYPHQIQMSPDYTRYFVTCQQTNELRVFDRATDTVIKVLPVGAKPQEMAISKSKQYLFVVCMEDASNTRAGARGSVYVFDYITLQPVTILYGDFYQPHDITVDEQDGLLYICNTNSSPNGPAPHHVSGSCNGRPGWYTVYNLNTLQMDNKRYEVSVFPYAIAARFK